MSIHGVHGALWSLGFRVSSVFRSFLVHGLQILATQGWPHLEGLWVSPMGNAAALQDVSRVLDTSLASLGVLTRIVTDPQQAARLGELISKHDFPVLLRALTSRGERLPPDFFPTWIRKAGGYFPKFAQVLSVRADLIDDPEVLAGLSRCLEDMPKRPHADVITILEQAGWHDASSNLGRALNAGTVAQVNEMSFLVFGEGDSCRKPKPYTLNSSDHRQEAGL